MQEGELRDELAMERTHLANERTVLAYIRTALACAAGGAALLQFFPERVPTAWGAWILIAAGLVLMAIGSWRFFAVRRRLKR